MKGTNFILGYVEDGNPSIADHYGNGLTKHSADEELGGSSHVELMEASEDDGGTMLHFTIPLDSGDEYDKPLTPGESYEILLAYSSEDDFVTEHGDSERTKIEVEL